MIFLENTTMAMTRPCRFCLLLAAVLCLAFAARAADDAPAQGAGEFVLGPGDVVAITVWKQPSLSLTLPVAPDGGISYPLVGHLVAAGLTVRQLESLVTTRLREQLKDPQVSVALQDARSYRVYVIGEVARPGEFEVKGPVTVLQAIAMAGGFTPFAARSKVAVVATPAHGGERRGFDYDAFVAGRGNVTNLILMPGDTVVVK